MNFTSGPRGLSLSVSVLERSFLQHNKAVSLDLFFLIKNEKLTKINKPQQVSIRGLMPAICHITMEKYFSL